MSAIKIWHADPSDKNKSLPSSEKPQACTIMCETCRHSQDVFINCTSIDQLSLYITKAEDRGTCKCCGMSLGELCIVIIPQRVTDGDPLVIDLAKRSL